MTVETLGVIDWNMAGQPIDHSDLAKQWRHTLRIGLCAEKQQILCQAFWRRQVAFDVHGQLNQEA